MALPSDVFFTIYSLNLDINHQIMQTTYRLKAHEISMTFLKSLKTLFAGQDLEIVVKTLEPGKDQIPQEVNKSLLEMVKDNRQKAPVISRDKNIRKLIDESHNSDNI